MSSPLSSETKNWEDDSVGLFPPAPPEAQALLREASRSWSDTAKARRFLSEADRLHGESLPVVLGCYKFYFYKGLLREAIPFALRAAEMMGQRLGLRRSFMELSLEDAPFSDYVAGPRFYLFAMKAAGYLYARLGETERGLEILEKIRTLDKNDHLGVSPLIAVIRRGGREEE